MVFQKVVRSQRYEMRGNRNETARNSRSGIAIANAFSIESYNLNNSLSLFRILYRRPMAIVDCAGSNTSVETVDPLQRLTRSLIQLWKITPTFLVRTTLQWSTRMRGSRIAGTRTRLLNLELSFRMIRLKIKYLVRSHLTSALTPLPVKILPTLTHLSRNSMKLATGKSSNFGAARLNDPRRRTRWARRNLHSRKLVYAVVATGD